MPELQVAGTAYEVDPEPGWRNLAVTGGAV